MISQFPSNLDYTINPKVKLITDNKVEVKVAKDLLVIPSFVLDSQKNETVGFENGFKIEPDTNIQKYNSTTPYLQVGLSYTW